jgi:hypothetical protein
MALKARSLAAMGTGDLPGRCVTVWARLDWFRLMSWYHSGIGFFMNTTFLMASVYLSAFVLFIFAAC